ncbi:hypothetical protein [Actinoplanes sp. GCM10030250]|uniref:hypothetical protein n=1 Tax=Actinoplanes sp. GCM10030250 TaxID=3273376 RepID=UPI00361F8D72
MILQVSEALEGIVSSELAEAWPEVAHCNRAGIYFFVRLLQYELRQGFELGCSPNDRNSTRLSGHKVKARVVAGDVLGRRKQPF